MTKMKEFYTDYATAAKWGGTSLILCNNIAKIDDSIYDNMEFNYFNENDEPIDIYQWYLTDDNADDVEWKKETFPELLYTYSDLLDCYVLCVNHFGTLWSGVATLVKNPRWIEFNKDKEYKL